MDAPTAQAIASICGLLATIAVVVGQVILGRQLASVKELVNGQSHVLNRLTGDEAYGRGLAAGLATDPPAPTQAPRSIESR
jgi:hypothetical protein